MGLKVEITLYSNLDYTYVGIAKLGSKPIYIRYTSNSIPIRYRENNLVPQLRLTLIFIAIEALQMAEEESKIDYFCDIQMHKAFCRVVQIQYRCVIHRPQVQIRNNQGSRVISQTTSGLKNRSYLATWYRLKHHHQFKGSINSKDINSID